MHTTTITPLTKQELLPIIRLFNTCAETELPYKKLSCDTWTDLFFHSTEQTQKYLFQAKYKNQLVGFSGGCRDTKTGCCYITFVLVAKEYRQKGIGRMLLEALEKELTAQWITTGPTSVKLQINFFNPCGLTWLIPNTPGHDHPNAPGVDTSSDAFLFFEAVGYSPYVYQNSFYLSLKDYPSPTDYLPMTGYAEPPFILERKAALSSQGITFEFYDSEKHHGLAELCDDLGNPVWKEELLANDALGENGHPLMAVIRKNKIVGFAGPLRVQESGRGYFAGIGIHSDCRGLGVGTVLFHTLCASLKGLGAEFMTLFTGTENPAGDIYKKAGFKIVKTWADMEKKL